MTATTSLYKFNPYHIRVLSQDSFVTSDVERDSVGSGSSGNNTRSPVSCAGHRQPESHHNSMVEVVSRRAVRQAHAIPFEPSRGKKLACVLRVLPNDQRIAHDLEFKLSASDRSALFAYFASDPAAMLSLFMNDRGNILVQLLSLLPNDCRCEMIRMFLLDNLLQLALSRLGVVALIRVFESSPECFKRRMQIRLLDLLCEITAHEFGSFVALTMFDSANGSGEFHSEFLRRAWKVFFESDTALVQIAGCRRSCRAFEVLVKCAPDSLKAEMVKDVNKSPQMVSRLSNERWGARLLQNIMSHGV